MKTSSTTKKSSNATRSTHRRLDAICFGLILAVATVAIVLAQRTPEEGGLLEVPDFHPPDLEFEVPFDFPYTIVRFKEREAPRLVLSGSLERVLIENRSVLLEGSAASELEVAVERVGRSEHQLASVRD